MEEGIAVCDIPPCVILCHGCAAMHHVMHCVAPWSCCNVLCVVPCVAHAVYHLHCILPVPCIAYHAVCLSCEGAGEVSEGAEEVGGCGMHTEPEE